MKFAILLNDNEVKAIRDGICNGSKNSYTWNLLANRKLYSYYNSIDIKDGETSEMLINKLFNEGNNVVLFETSSIDGIFNSYRNSAKIELITVLKINRTIDDLNQCLSDCNEYTLVVNNPFLEGFIYTGAIEVDNFILNEHASANHDFKQITGNGIVCLKYLSNLKDFDFKLTDNLISLIVNFNKASAFDRVGIYCSLWESLMNRGLGDKKLLLKSMINYLNSFKWAYTAYNKMDDDNMARLINIIKEYDAEVEVVNSRFKLKSVQFRALTSKLFNFNPDFFIDNCDDFLNKYAIYIATSSKYQHVRDLPIEYITSDIFDFKALDVVLDKPSDEDLRKKLKINNLPTIVSFIISSFDNLNTYSEPFVYINCVSKEELEEHVDVIASKFMDICVKRSYDYMHNRSCGVNKENMEIFMKAVYRDLDRRNIRVIKSFLTKCFKWSYSSREEGRIMWNDYANPALFSECERVSRVYLEMLI